MNFGSSGPIIVWILIFIGIFYFLAVRPQRRQKQAHDQMERMLKKGDEVVTLGGMFGTVARIGDDWVDLQVAKRTKVRFLKRAIASITTSAEEVEDEEEYIEAEDEDVEEIDETAEEIEGSVDDADDVDDATPESSKASEARRA